MRSEFSRFFTLPANADLQNINAEIKHDTLIVTLPKMAQAQPERRKIDVHAAEDEQKTVAQQKTSHASKNR